MDWPFDRPEAAVTTFNLALAPDGKCRSSNATNLQNLVADGRLSMGITTVEELENGGSRGSVGQPAAPRKTYKSCEYCARRKRRCDGDGVNRCSLCIAKNRTECVYRQKPPRKTMKPKPAVQHERRPVLGAASTECPPEWFRIDGGETMGVPTPGGALVQQQYGSMVKPRQLPLKRCRLSASPATGLLGMQENVFLNDYFGCLGLLPLASESTVRQAMIELMMEHAARAQQQLHRASFYSGGSEDKRRGGDFLPSPFLEHGDPSKCVMWCAIALGALVQGAPVEKVTGYVQLARNSLAQCFDGGTIETARAYIAMSVLHFFLGDNEKNQKYLSFATDIIARLPKRVPKNEIVLLARPFWMLWRYQEVANMLLTADNSRCFKNKKIPDPEDELDAHCEDILAMPMPEQIVHESELCNIFLVANKRLNEAFTADMFAQGVFGVCNSGGGEDTSEMRGVEGGMLRPSGEAGESQGTTATAQSIDGVSASNSCASETINAGNETRRLIKEFLPELVRVSRVAVGSGATKGVGGLLYHGTIAYLRAVEGKMSDAFADIFSCAQVILRYPGVCRFRPHLTHCILASSAVASRPVYNQVRAAYNSTRSPGWKPAPPFEEWTGMSGFCDHALCRSVQTELRKFDYKGNGEVLPISTDVRATSSQFSSFAESCDHVANVGGIRRSPPPLSPSMSKPLTGKTSMPLETPSSTLTPMMESPPVVPPTPSGVDTELSPRGLSPSGAFANAAAAEAGLRLATGSKMRPAEESSVVVAAATAFHPASHAHSFPMLSASFATRDSIAESSARDSSVNAEGDVIPMAELLGARTNFLAPSSAAATPGNDMTMGATAVTSRFVAEASGMATDSDCLEASAVPASAQVSTSCMPECILFGEAGVDDASCDLRITEEDLMDAADVLLSEGLIEGESGDDNVEYVD